MSNDEELEKIVKELISLARRKPLYDEDQARAKKLMVSLKEMGFTNQNISNMTESGWSEATVKVYTRGATVQDPEPKTNAIQLLTQMVNLGLTFKDVREAISIRTSLFSKGIALEDVSSLLAEAKAAKINVKDVLQMHRNLQASKLSISQLSEALTYKSQLDQQDFPIEGLGKIVKASEAYGGYSRVMEAIEIYGKIESIQSQLRTIEEQFNKLKTDFQALEEKRKAVEGALSVYEDLKRLGFEEATLRELKKASDKYGGVKTVIEAVDTYTNLAQLQDEMKDLETKKGNVGSDLKTLQADYAHLQTIVAMCDALLYKHHFSVPAVEDIYRTAKRYGEPLEVIRAIGRYGEVKAIEAQSENLSTQRNKLESKVGELKRQVQSLRATAEEVANSTRGLLKPLASEIESGAKSMKDAFIQATQTLGATYQQSFNSLRDAYEEYAKKLGELKAEAGRFEEELKIAKVVCAITKYPSEAKELPLDNALILQDTVAKLCLAKNVNPKVTPKDTIYPSVGVKLLDLIDLVKTGITSVIQGALK